MRKEIKVGDVVYADDLALYGNTPMEVLEVGTNRLGWGYANLRILFGPHAGTITTESTYRLEHYTQEKSHD